MVNVTETPVEAGDDSPAEDVSSPVVEDSSGDEPLIPDQTPSEELAVPPDEPEAPETEAPEAGDSQPAEAEASEKAEPETPEERTFTQDEWSTRETTLQRSLTEAKTAAESAEKAATEAKELYGQQSSLREIEGYRQALVTEFTEQGVDKPEVLATQQAQLAKTAFDLDQENQKLKAELVTVTEQNTSVAGQALALKVSGEVGLDDPVDRAELMKEADEEGMKRRAREILDAKAFRESKTTAKQAEVPAATEETQLDAGGGDATETDASFEARVSEAAWPLPEADQKRLNEIQAARR